MTMMPRWARKQMLEAKLPAATSPYADQDTGIAARRAIEETLDSQEWQHSVNQNRKVQDFKRKLRGKS